MEEPTNLTVFMHVISDANAPVLHAQPPFVRQGRRSPPRARSQLNSPTSEAFIQPTEMRSANGSLDLTMTAAPGPVHLGDRAFSGLLYNGVYVPPTLRVRLGDTLRIPSATT